MSRQEFIFSGPENTVKIDERGLGWALFENLKKNASKVGQICTETKIEETFGEILQKSVRTAIEMQKRNIQSGNTICLFSFMSLNACVPIYSSLFLNCKVISISPFLPINDIIHCIKLIQPKMVFVHEEAEETLENVVNSIPGYFPEVIAFTKSEKFDWFEDFLNPCSEEMEFCPIVVDDIHETAFIFLTSGVSSTPKMVTLSHYSLLKQHTLDSDNTMNSVDYSKLRVLSFASFSWMSSFFIAFMTVQCGMPRIVIPKFEVKNALRVIKEYKPFMLFCSPWNVLQMIYGNEDNGSSIFSSIKILYAGGHRVTPEQSETIERALNNALYVKIYGQTEAGGAISRFAVGDSKHIALLKNKKMSCGTVVPGMSYKVVDIYTNELCGPYKQGELHIKADYLLKGYLDKDESVFDENGWYNTKDVVYYDEDHCFYVVDRNIDLIKVRSTDVASFKIESVICQQDIVENAAVIGVLHPVNGMAPLAFVKLKKNVTALAEDIKKAADEQLNNFEKLTGGLIIVDDFVMTDSGKINKFVLKKLLNPDLV